MKKKILVTGGTGFIGSAICNFFSNKGYHLTILDNNSRGKSNRIKKSKNIKIVNGDITNYNDVYRSAVGQSHIFHLAAINGTKFFYEKPDKVLDVACKGAINIIDVAKTADAIGLKSFALLGKGGGEYCKLNLDHYLVKEDKTSIIQEAHITIGHLIIEFVESKLNIKLLN